MAPIEKTVRVFISSTFRDMQAERDCLVKRVFPALRQRLEKHRIHLVDIDLRWGITRDQANRDQVLGLCLQQIDKCRPFFLGILGERYGWVPTEIPSEVRKFYGWTQHHRGKSMTELEILHGALNDPAMHRRTLFCFRSEKFLNEIKDEQQYRIFVEGPTDAELREFGGEESKLRAANRCQQLANLKNQLRSLLPPTSLFDGYPCAWESDALDTATKQLGCIGGLTEFGSWVINNLERTILEAPELQEHLAAVHKAHDELAEERAFHERFIEDRTRVYIGRRHLQEELKAFVLSTEAKSCLVTGASGSGKSAALAKFVGMWREENPEDVVISHFVGASPYSTSLRETLRHICLELKDGLNLENEINQDIRELQKQISEFLANVPTNRRVVLVLDALDQLDETDNAHSLFWLPRQIPPQVRLIASCIDDPDRPTQLALASMHSDQPHEIKVGLLTDDERLGIVREVPSVSAKTLDEQQIQLLLGNASTRNPLFLLVALEELRGFGSFEKLNQKIAGLPQTGDTLQALFQQVIRRLGEDFNTTTVKDVLTLLACARRGLSERELLDLIEGRNARIEESTGDLFPILRQLRPFLQSRGSLLDFYHRHLAKATYEEFFNADENMKCFTHERLAKYFHDQDYFLESLEEQRARVQRLPPTPRPANVRKVDELPWQYLQVAQLSGNWDAVEELFTDLFFLEAKAEADMVFHLAGDFTQVIEKLPSKRSLHGILLLLEEALSRDIHFIARHPTTLFQCLWNSCWWYDCPAAAKYYEEPKGGWKEPPPWSLAKDMIWQIADMWQKEKNKALPAFRWVRSLRPPSEHLGSGLRGILRGHKFGIAGIACSPNNLRIATASLDGSIRIWDSQSGKELHCFVKPDENSTAVCFSADGSRVVGAWSDNSIQIWNTNTWAESISFSTAPSKLTFLTFSDDGSRIAGACNDGKVLVWDTDNGRMVICVQGESETESVTFLHGESVIAAVWNDGRVFVVDIDENRNLSTFKVPGEVEYAAFSTEGHQLICGSWNSLCIWDLRVGREVWRIPLEGTPLMALALSRDGHTIVICDQNGIVNTWDSEIGQEIGWFKPMMEEWDVPQVCFSWDGKRIVVGSQSSGDVYILDVRGGEMPRSLYGTTYSSLYPISHLSFAPDGCQFASATTNGLVHIWDASTGEHIRCLSGHHDLMRSIVFTSDSRRLITGSWDKTVRLWQIESGEVLQSFDSSSRFCISPDDRHIVVAQELGSLIQVFNTDNREEHCRLNGLLGNAFSMAYSTDSGHIAAGGLMGSICVWDADSGQREFFFIFESLYAVRCITFSRNGRFLANGCDDGKIHLWDLGTREEVRCFEGHQDEVDLLMFSQDGGRIISQSSNFETRIWDVETSRCLEVINGQTDINALAAGSILQPYRVIAQDGETIIYLADTGDTVGWWPDALSSLAAHQSGLVWIGASGKYITLIKFEGES